MPHRHVLVECRQGSGERGGGVALHQQHLRLFGLDHRFEGYQDARRDLRQRLPGLHQVQVVIRRHIECRQHLIQHRAMLRRHTDAHLKPRALPQVQQHRAELDGFGPRAEDKEDLMRHSQPPV